jgi:ABC-type uncharacterized transport system auxiliary subunit
MKPILPFFIIVIFVLTGCFSEKKVERRYYTIEIPEDLISPKTDSISEVKGSCEIERVVVNDVYAKNQIVNRARSNEISYFVYNQWAVNPSDAITQLIGEYLEVAGTFQNISDRNRMSIPDFRFRTYINNLELIETGKSFSAHLSLEFKLIDNSDNKTLVSYKADRVNPLEQKDLNMFANEISTILLQELNKFTSMILDERELISGNPGKK